MAAPNRNRQYTVTDPFDAIINGVMLRYQREDILSNDRFRWNCWSRQTGKSFAKSFRRLARGIARQRDQLFLSAGGRQSRELMMKARQHCEAMKIAFNFGEHEAGAFEGMTYTQLEIRLPEAGIKVLGLPANPETARGFSGDVLLDEFAMHRADRDIWGAMFPSILRKGGELDVASTPRGKQNKFYELADNEEFGHQVITIEDAMEQGLAGVDIDQLKAAMGDEMLFRQEFMCEFVDEATAFITLEMIRACEDESLPVELDVDELAACKGDVLVGMDIGRYRDLTVIWALEAVGTQLISRGLIEMHNKPFAAQFAALCRVMQAQCVRKCCIDASGLGMQMAEQAADRFGAFRVEGHQFSANLKEEMGAKLRVWMEEKRLSIPAAKRLRDDLHSVEKSVTIDGKIRLRATRQGGSHADRFWALALAVYAAAEKTGTVEGVMGRKLRTAGAAA